MDAQPPAVPGGPEGDGHRPGPPPAPPGRRGRSVRDRLIGGLILAMPIVITVGIIVWLYSTVVRLVIDPLVWGLLWKIQLTTSATVPDWFETYVAPVIAVLLALALLICLDLIADTRLRRSVDWTLRRVPVISHIYNPLQKIFETLDQTSGQQPRPRMVLITFPHPGVKVPAFVTATCRDVKTHKVLLCVYVPTTPVPTSGFMLLVPEEEVTELNWSTEQALQAVISGGLVAPPEVSYYKDGSVHQTLPGPPLVPSAVPPRPPDG
jgi:uncharacterized membrane protein